MELHDREYAESIYNKICDEFEIFEEDRFDDELDTDDIQRVQDIEEQIFMLESRKADTDDTSYLEEQIEKRKEDIEVIKRRSDRVRESLIKAIQRSNLYIDDETSKVKYRLRYPIEKMSEITFKPNFQQRDFDEQMKGVKMNDEMGMISAQLACFCNMSRIKLKLIYKKDMNVIQAVSQLFTRAD